VSTYSTWLLRSNCAPITCKQWRTQKISQGSQVYVTIVWRHKSTLGKVAKVRPF